MKKTYEIMIVEIICVIEEDIIRTSLNQNDNELEMPDFPEFGNFAQN